MMEDMKQQVLFVLLDGFADWEAAFLAAALRTGTMPGSEGRYETLYAAPGGRTVRSLGGLTVVPDCDLAALPERCAGLVLVGGIGWQGAGAEQVVPLVGWALEAGIPIGAICNATLFLAAHGFLDRVRHTGNTVEEMRRWGGDRYRGAALYEERQAVADGPFITANGTGYLEFSREFLLRLGADTPEVLAAWYAFNRNGFYGE